MNRTAISGPEGPGPCRHDGSRLVFRGPWRPLEGARVAVLGGSETFARGRALAWPERLERLLGERCLNLAPPCGSVEAALGDCVVMAAAQRASATVVAVTGAANLSNRLYGVHPRRNDRVVRVSAALRVLFPDVDLAEVCFTGHLLRVLEAADPDRFDVVREELRIAWAARMRTLIDQVGGPVWLLWLAEAAPPGANPAGDPLGPEPRFVTRGMIEALRPLVAGIVEAVGEGREAVAAEALAGALRSSLGAADLRAAG